MYKCKCTCNRRLGWGKNTEKEGGKEEREMETQKERHNSSCNYM